MKPLVESLGQSTKEKTVLRYPFPYLFDKSLIMKMVYWCSQCAKPVFLYIVFVAIDLGGMGFYRLMGLTPEGNAQSISPFMDKKTKMQVGYLVGCGTLLCNLSAQEAETEASSYILGQKGS